MRIYRSLGAGKTETLTKMCLEFAVSVSHSCVRVCVCVCVCVCACACVCVCVCKIYASCRTKFVLMTYVVCCSLLVVPVLVPENWYGNLSKRSGRG